VTDAPGTDGGHAAHDPGIRSDPFPGQDGRFPIDAVNAVGQIVARQGVAVSAEGVGLDEPGTRFVILPVDVPDELRTREIQFLAAPADGNPLLVQPGGHRPIADYHVPPEILPESASI